MLWFRLGSGFTSKEELIPERTVRLRKEVLINFNVLIMQSMPKIQNDWSLFQAKVRAFLSMLLNCDST